MDVSITVNFHRPTGHKTLPPPSGAWSASGVVWGRTSPSAVPWPAGASHGAAPSPSPTLLLLVLQQHTTVKQCQHSKWRLQHPRYNKTDPYYFLTRQEQVTVFRLRTGNNRLNHHLYSILRISHKEQHPGLSLSHTHTRSLSLSLHPRLHDTLACY